jgi:hypothetical protein
MVGMTAVSGAVTLTPGKLIVNGKMQTGRARRTYFIVCKFPADSFAVSVPTSTVIHKVILVIRGIR